MFGCYVHADKLNFSIMRIYIYIYLILNCCPIFIYFNVLFFKYASKSKRFTKILRIVSCIFSGGFEIYVEMKKFIHIRILL